MFVYKLTIQHTFRGEVEYEIERHYTTEKRAIEVWERYRNMYGRNLRLRHDIEKIRVFGDRDEENKQ